MKSRVHSSGRVAHSGWDSVCTHRDTTRFAKSGCVPYSYSAPQKKIEKIAMSDEISRKDPRLLKNLATLNWETGEIIPATDLIHWAVTFERHDKHVGYDEVSGFIVSTVFMGINQTRGRG